MSTPHGSDAGGAARPPILLIESYPSLREGIGWFLETDGYAVCSLDGCSDALAHLRRAPDTGLILVNLHLPGVGDFRSEQLRDQQLSAIPVVGYSAYQPPPRRGLPRLAAYLQLPQQSDALLEVVRAHYAPGCVL